jgi:hypothetical protein
LKNVLQEAEQAKGCTVELPWRSAKGVVQYSLAVRVELAGGEPIWTLYEGEGASSHIVWSTPFDDLELLRNVLSLTVPSEGIKTDIPANVKPAPNGSNAKAATDTARGKGQTQPTATPGAASPPVSPQSAPAPAPGPAIPPPYPYGQPVPPGYGPYPQGYPAAPYPPPGYPYPVPYNPAYPTYPPPNQGNPQQYPPGYYPGYFPGYVPYVYPSPVPNQYQSADSVSTAATVPIKPGPPPSNGEGAPIPVIKPDLELLKKSSNMLLGHFLVESGLIPEPTMHAALRLQELVKKGLLTGPQAAEAIKRTHERGGGYDTHLKDVQLGKVRPELDRVGPPLGQLLVEAGLMSSVVLKAALKLQEVVRSGVMTKEDACKTLYTECFGATKGKGVKESEEDSPQANRVIRLLLKAGLISDQDIVRAKNILHKHGGKVSKIIIASGKVDQATFDAATECEVLVASQKIKLERAIIALHYCQRSRTTFKDAVRELGWEKL